MRARKDGREHRKRRHAMGSEIASRNDEMVEFAGMRFHDTGDMLAKVAHLVEVES